MVFCNFSVMPQVCTVCRHNDLNKINSELIQGLTPYELARYYSLNRNSMQRHFENHLPQQLVKANEARAVTNADRLLSEMQLLHERTENILTKAEETNNPLVALRAIREMRGNFELLAKILGILNSAPTINIDVTALSDDELDRLIGSDPRRR